MSTSNLAIRGAARRSQIVDEAGTSTSAYTVATTQPEYHVSTDELPTESTPHPDLWFPDGSVVLAAQSTLFRVHKSVLARHSHFFRDMFSLPQPTSSQAPPRPDLTNVNGNPEGCPVVHLYDSSEDLANLLRALYDGPTFGNNDQADFRVVSGILRLANKYLIDSLRAKALEHLSIAWPSTLKGWDVREDLAGEYYVDADCPRYYPNPVEVINLAREIAAPALLPAAFYDLSRYQFSQIFESGTNASQLGLQALSLVDTQKLVLGKEAAQYAVSGLIRSMASETQHAYVAAQHHHPRHPNPAHATAQHPHANAGPHQTNLRSAHKRSGSCTSAAACRRDASELVDLATQHYLFDRERGASDPLYVGEELGLLKSTELEGSECKACGRALELWASRERERLWRAIPGWFRLEN